MGHWALAAGWAEQRALRLLRQQGWLLLSRNWHCRWGELDLVLYKPGRLLVIEVKGRSTYGPDAGGVSALRGPKRARLRRALSCWLAAHPAYGSAQIRLMAALVSLPPQRHPVRWLPLTDWG